MVLVYAKFNPMDFWMPSTRLIDLKINASTIITIIIILNNNNAGAGV